MNNIPEIEEYLSFLKMSKSSNTVTVYNTAIKKLFDFLKINDLEDISKVSPKDIRNHQDHLSKSGLSPSSVNTNIRPIRAMFNWLVENEYLEKSPLAKVKDLVTKKKVPAFLTEDEQDKVVDACDNITDRVIMAIFLSSGLRRNEVCALKLSDFNGTHILVSGKGNKERSLRLQDVVIDLLNTYLKYRMKKYGNKTDALIVSKMSKPYTGSMLYKKTKAILKKAGLPEDRIEKIHPHSLRHTFCANFLSAGNDIFMAQNALGHSDIKTTMIYAHLNRGALDNAMEKNRQILKGKENV